MTRDFAAELAELRRVYIASLPLKLDEVAAAVARRSLDDACALAHRLRGTAGSYGVPTVSAALGAIEDRIEAAGADPDGLSAELEELIAAARRAIGALS